MGHKTKAVGSKGFGVKWVWSGLDMRLAWSGLDMRLAWSGLDMRLAWSGLDMSQVWTGLDMNWVLPDSVGLGVWDNFEALEVCKLEVWGVSDMTVEWAVCISELGLREDMPEIQDRRD